MAYQITRVRKEPRLAPRAHQHIAMVQLSDGTYLTRREVIDAINRGATFYTQVGGYTAWVYVRSCPACYSGDYITTSADGTTANNLDNLPEF